MVFSSILMGVAALGAAAMGVKYGFGPVPATYHAEIIGKDGAGATGQNTLHVLTALYRVLGGALIAVALLVAALALGPIRAGAFWAVFVATLAGLCVAVPAAIVPFRVERATGIATPWKVGAIFAVVLLLGLGASVL